MVPAYLYHKPPLRTVSQLPAERALAKIDEKTSTFAVRLFRSPTFWTTVAAGAALLSIAAAVTLLCYGSPALLAMGLFIGTFALATVAFSFHAKNKAKINYEVSLLYNKIWIDPQIVPAPKGKNTRAARNVFANEIPVGHKNKLFLGSLPMKRDARELLKHGVKTVLSTIEGFEFSESVAGSPLTCTDLREINITQQHLPTTDFDPLSHEELWVAADTIQAGLEKGNVYVHCKAGRGRSAMAIAAYLILHEKKSATEAIEHLKQYRPVMTLKKEKEKFKALQQLEAGREVLQSSVPTAV